MKSWSVTNERDPMAGKITTEIQNSDGMECLTQYLWQSLREKYPFMEKYKT